MKQRFSAWLLGVSKGNGLRPVGHLASLWRHGALDAFFMPWMRISGCRDCNTSPCWILYIYTFTNMLYYYTSVLTDTDNIWYMIFMIFMIFIIIFICLYMAYIGLLYTLWIMNYYILRLWYIYIRIQFSPGVKATATLNPGRNFTELFFAQTMNSSWIV